MRRYLLASVARSVLVVSLVASAWYAALSVYWWEWQRAFFYSLLFLGCLVLLVFLLLRRRLDRLEEQVRTRTTGTGEPAADDLPVAPSRTFPWLDPGRTHVFVPLLVGFGVVVSLVAMAIERVADFVVGDRRGPVGRVRTALAFVLATLLVAALVVPFVGHLVYDPTDPEPGRREVEVAVQARRAELDPVGAVGALASFCVAQTRAPLVVDAIDEVAADIARITVHPRLDPDAQRRFEGCLSDLVLDRHRTWVVAVRDV